MCVQAISPEGILVGYLPVSYEDGWMKFTIGYKKFPSIYYRTTFHLACISPGKYPKIHKSQKPPA